MIKFPRREIGGLSIRLLTIGREMAQFADSLQPSLPPMK